jgi:hypothetical protein
MTLSLILTKRAQAVRLASETSSSALQTSVLCQPGKERAFQARTMKLKRQTPAFCVHPVDRRWRIRGLVIVLVSGLGCFSCHAQLAITEVMSWASTNCAGCPDVGPRGCHPDFWELTNFGTNRIDLSDYLFMDEQGVFPLGAWKIPKDMKISIDPNESIVFVRYWPEVSDAASFRQWWGEFALPVNLQIIFYPDHGFDFLGDAVRLWDADSNIVDQVYFGESRRGSTFSYETNFGAAVQSEFGVCGAFQAANCGDVGSPGRACGPVALQIIRQPISQTVDAGGEVTFQVQAVGLPRPRGYQWYFNDVVIPIILPGADSIPVVINYAGCGLAWKTGPGPADLVISNVQPSHAGQYFVVFSNGLERLTSAVVTLTVNTNRTPPHIKCPPAELHFPAVDGHPWTNLIVSPRQTAMFQVLVRGYPPPSFQWSRSLDGGTFTDIPDATDPMLIISDASPLDTGIYRVRVQNPLGTEYAFARLLVKENPRLKITEVMTDSRIAHEDWWELTNVGQEPANVYGYRWADFQANIGGGPTITQSVIIQPGESVIFLEGHTPEFFRTSWGASNLPPNLQFIRYTANGLNQEGDEINLWSPTALDDSDLIDTVDFALASPGATFWFDDFVCVDDEFVRVDTPSVEGQCGAFRSAQGGDVGSPGWTRWTPPRLTSIQCDGSNVRLEWKAQPGSETTIEYAPVLGLAGNTIWSELGTYTFSSATCVATDTASKPAFQRFYRVKRKNPAPCQCPQF